MNGTWSIVRRTRGVIWRSEDGDGDKEKGKHENVDEDICTTRIYNVCYTFITRIRNGSWSIIRRTRRVI